MKYIKLYEGFKDPYPYELNLENYESALEFASKYADQHLFKGGELDLDSTYSTDNTSLKDRILLYMNKFAECKNMDRIEVYRSIRLSDLGDLSLNKLGNCWSFDKKCAYPHGYTKVIESIEKDFILTGLISNKDINWKYGFINFLTFSIEQWECYINTGSKVEITNINDKVIKLIGTI